MKRTDAIKVIKKLLAYAVEHEASDIFISVGYPPAMKMDGRIKPLNDDPVTLEEARQLVTCVMRDRHLKEFDATKECNFAISPNEGGRFRVNAYIQRGCPAMVMRRISTEPPNLDELKLPPILKDIAMTKRGLVMVVGATGSGKSTTLAAMIDHRNQNSHGHIITLEDPIEFVHPHKGCLVSQREVGVDTDDWGIALKNSLRQAPNVILLGEIRDRETMDQAIQIAETGHLALATIHANNANQVLDRIINFFPEDRREQLLLDLSLNLRAIVSQRLIPEQDGVGRAAAVEILLNTPLVSDFISEGEVEKIKEIMERSIEEGMQTFDQALFDLYENQVIARDAALRNADSTNDLRYRIKLYSKRFKAEEPESSADFTMVEEADKFKVR
ncbi:MAG: PilT/PilU family type 4a pilus ATPase [Gammaproteobacteria bacterium]|nr:PilT/PilU family type 4a pilus ATPase [Gammaproteobacteria bacterium]